MASYLITGVSRGIGFEFLNYLSNNPKNTVIGLVRNKEATEGKIRKELGERQNVHILTADLTNFGSLKENVPNVTQITGGKLDYIIANAALMSHWSEYDPLSVLGNSPDRLTEDLQESFNNNVIGNIHLFNLFLPLVINGNAKKVIFISTGMADLELVSQFSVTAGAPYAMSKAAMNLAVAKFSAEYSKDGVLFMSISPGLVDTGRVGDNITEEQKAGLQEMSARFAEYAPHFKGPATPASSVRDVLAVIDNSSLAAGDGGSFVSHLGSKQWL